jgi:hypothetical protein
MDRREVVCQTSQQAKENNPESENYDIAPSHGQDYTAKFTGDLSKWKIVFPYATWNYFLTYLVIAELSKGDV